MDFVAYQKSLGAALAQDQIPLHYGDLSAEYQAALHQAVMLVRSHEGRIILAGEDCHRFIDRISTNRIPDLRPGQGMPTLFLSPQGRMQERITVYDTGENLLLITEPGRGPAVLRMLQGQIFFNDRVTLADLGPATQQFALHGPSADAIMTQLGLTLQPEADLSYQTLDIAGSSVRVLGAKALVSSQWLLIVPDEASSAVYEALRSAGAASGLRPAGSLLHNVLRIRAGRPGARELSADYIPLELGLWDEIHFAKGCYTGQEIIARMESREKLAKTLVSVALERAKEAPAPLYHAGQQVGTLTSAVQAPDGAIFAMAVLKVAAAYNGTELQNSDGQPLGRVSGPLGVQAPYLNLDADPSASS